MTMVAAAAAAADHAHHRGCRRLSQGEEAGAVLVPVVSGLVTEYAMVLTG